jgi:hypothetical protein
MKAILALEDGRTFPCQSFIGPGETMAMCKGIAALKKKRLSVKTLQEYSRYPRAYARGT